MVAYLEEVLPQDMTPSTKQSWSTFVTSLTEALADALERQEHTPANYARQHAYTSSWVEVGVATKGLAGNYLGNANECNIWIGSMNFQRVGRLWFTMRGEEQHKAGENCLGPTLSAVPATNLLARAR